MSEFKHISDDILSHMRNNLWSYLRGIEDTFKLYEDIYNRSKKLYEEKIKICEEEIKERGIS